MQIANNSVVSMNYTLTNDAGDVLDQSDAQHPLVYLHGANNIIPGLENALHGKQAGDKLTVTVNPEDGYGEYDETLIQVVPRTAFANIPAEHLLPGAEFQAQTHEGVQLIRIVDVEDQNITIDGNHPLAGEQLTFQVEILAVRAADAQEITHGHVHTPGMHHH